MTRLSAFLFLTLFSTFSLSAEDPPPAQDKVIFLAPEGETIGDPSAGSGQAPEAKIDESKLSDDEFLDMIERDSVRFYAELISEKSGLVTEDNSTSHVGSNGFWLVALCIGAERNYISRD